MNNQISVIPISNIVFFPNTAISLYIVEPAYVKMVLKHIADREMIAVSNAETFNTQGGKSTTFTPKSICTMGHAVLLEKLPDGTIKIIINGIAKINLTNVVQNIPYLICQYEVIHETTKYLSNTGYFLDHKIQRLKSIMEDWIIRNIDEALERENFLHSLDSIATIIDYIGMHIITDIEVKQLLLENNNQIEKINIIDSLLKDYNPYQEDATVADALKDFRYIEQTAKLGH